jgi:tRNA threonylcarbamoyladenosine biosynthesis protein TsaB
MDPIQSRNNSEIVLAIDTSSATTSLAVARGESIIASRACRHEDRRSELLWNDIRDLLGSAGLRINDVDGFAVCVGPGGFTGLRVGIAAVLGFASSTGKPAAGVTSLEAVAFRASGKRRADELVCSLVGAYKGEVYSQLFEFDARGIPVAINESAVSTSEEAIARVSNYKSLIFAGDGVTSCLELIRAGQLTGREWSVMDDGYLVAESVALLAMRRPESWGEPLRACYVRPADAELKLAAGLLGSKIRRTLDRED